MGESCVDAEIEWQERVESFLQTRSDEERAYIKEVLPTLLESIKEASTIYAPSINGKLMETIIQNLLYTKEITLGMEDKFVKKMVRKEMDDISYNKPKERIKYDELAENKRKTKKSIKGHKNNSSMNHMNENYVSNIF